MQRLGAVNDAARDFELGASLAAIKAERHRLFLNLESRLPASRVPMFWGDDDGCPLTADGETIRLKPIKRRSAYDNDG